VVRLPCFQVIPSPNAFLDECEALVSVSVEDGTLSEDRLRDVLGSFGHLQSFYPSSGVRICPLAIRPLTDRSSSQCYIVEYSDSRSAQVFVDNAHGLCIPGARLRAELVTPKDLTEDAAPESPSPKPGRIRPRSVSAGESSKPRDLSITIPPLSSVESYAPETADFAAKSEPEEHHVRPSQFPAVSNPFFPSVEHYYPLNPPQLVYPLQSPTAYAFPQFEDPMPMHYQYPTYPYMYSPVESHLSHHSMHNWDYRYPSYPTSPHMVHPPAIDYSKRMPSHADYPRSPALLSPISPVFSTTTASDHSTPTQTPVAPRHQHQKPHHSTLHVRAPGLPPPPISEKNQLDWNKIEQGLDTRTTVMIKNIPNKMSDKDLLSFIGKVCPRRIDFMYLRMDFQNGES